MTYKLRYYQEDAVRYTFDYINKGGRAGIAALPTASGKSIVIAEIIKRILMKKPHVRAMMLTHVRELIIQNFEKIQSIWPTCPAGIYSAGVGFRQFSNPVTYGGVQSCYKKTELFGHIDVLFIDECHLVSENGETMYGQMIAGLKLTNPNLVVLGLTATPYRLGLGYLTNGPIFDDIYYDITSMEDMVRLIDEGFLSDLVSFNMENMIDTSKMKKLGGEFNNKSLDENVNRDEVTRAIVNETMVKAQGRNKGLAFCVNKQHAENMSMRFNEAGLRCMYMHDGLSKKERIDVLAAYERGEFNMLTNVGVLTTGFDAPDIDYLVCSRPTESASLHVQMLGRGMRVHPSKDNTMVLDFAGNCLRLGPINDPVIPQPKGVGNGDAPIRICDACGAQNHASARKCKECNEPFPPPKVKFSETIVQSDIIARRDMPKFENVKVSSVYTNSHRSANGNDTMKLTYVMDNEFIDDYFMFDRKQGGAYNNSMAKLKKMQFKEPVPDFADTSEAVFWVAENLLVPDGARIWTNKPVIGTTGRKKRKRTIMNLIYGEVPENE